MTITQRQYPVEPWRVREVGIDLKLLAASESVFALSNGHLGVRGNLDEGEPYGLPGTYLNSFREQRVLPYAESGFGYPETGESVVNITNGKIVRLYVDDEPLDLRIGTVIDHQRILDLRSGTLYRELIWRSPAGKSVRVRSTRLVSFTQRAIMALRYEVSALDDPVGIVLQSELVANEALPAATTDPRVGAEMSNVLAAEHSYGVGLRLGLMHCTRRTAQRVAVGAAHELHGVSGETGVHVEDDLVRLTISARLKPGESTGLTKYVAYQWSSLRTSAALRDQTEAALSLAQDVGWSGLLAEQKQFLDDFWQNADVVVEGSPALQQTVRFGMWHVLQAGARAEARAIPSKGLTGNGYDGHAFWDTEMFVLPVLTATMPAAAADALRWRHSTLGQARDRARTLGLAGAAFPWRTISGGECSAYWPAGTAALHVNGDIAAAARRLVLWTGDERFARNVALEIASETARFWVSRGHHGPDGLFHIDGVTGPDEYSALADDNIYTNLQAAQNLEFAADLCEKYPDKSSALRIDPNEVAAWRAAAAAISIPYDLRLRVHPQSRNFTGHAPFDFDAATGDYPLLLHRHYMELYRSQVVKQADLVLALHWFSDRFTPAQRARDFAYYEALTVRESSLSACTQAIVAFDVGQMELGFDYLVEAALTDLDDIQTNTGNGMHLASLAGTWLGLIAGVGGMREHGDELRFAPRLPAALTALAFRLRWRTSTLSVRITPDEAEYQLVVVGNAPVFIAHHGTALTLSDADPVRLPIPALGDVGPRPTQPVGREPLPGADYDNV